MARTDLTKMLGKLDDAEPAAPMAAVAEAGGEVAPATAATKVPGRPVRSPASPKPVPSAAQASAGYQSFERKEARLRADQYARLTQESRRLNRAKGPGGERITENTLIRVAIDLLLERADKLAGATEAELRNSVTP